MMLGQPSSCILCVYDPELKGSDLCYMREGLGKIKENVDFRRWKEKQSREEKKRERERNRGKGP